ncbi:MAG: hypothetical protein ACLUI7_11085, partial [Coprococcus sp.]
MAQNKEAGLRKIREQFNKQVGQLSKRKDRRTGRTAAKQDRELLERLQQDLYFTGMEQYQTFFYQENASLLDYLGHEKMLVLDEMNRIQESQEYLEKERRQTFSELLLKGSVLPGQAEYFFNMDELIPMVGAVPHVCFSLLPKASVFQQYPEKITL